MSDNLNAHLTQRQQLSMQCILLYSPVNIYSRHLILRIVTKLYCHNLEFSADDEVYLLIVECLAFKNKFTFYNQVTRKSTQRVQMSATAPS